LEPSEEVVDIFNDNMNSSSPELELDSPVISPILISSSAVFKGFRKRAHSSDEYSFGNHAEILDAEKEPMGSESGIQPSCDESTSEAIDPAVISEASTNSLNIVSDEILLESSLPTQAYADLPLSGYEKASKENEMDFDDPDIGTQAFAAIPLTQFSTGIKKNTGFFTANENPVMVDEKLVEISEAFGKEQHLSSSGLGEATLALRKESKISGASQAFRPLVLGDLENLRQSRQQQPNEIKSIENERTVKADNSFPGFTLASGKKPPPVSKSMLEKYSEVFSNLECKENNAGFVETKNRLDQEKKKVPSGFVELFEYNAKAEKVETPSSKLFTSKHNQFQEEKMVPQNENLFVGFASASGKKLVPPKASSIAQFNEIMKKKFSNPNLMGMDPDPIGQGVQEISKEPKSEKHNAFAGFATAAGRNLPPPKSSSFEKIMNMMEDEASKSASVLSMPKIPNSSANSLLSPATPINNRHSIQGGKWIEHKNPKGIQPRSMERKPLAQSSLGATFNRATPFKVPKFTSARTPSVGAILQESRTPALNKSVTPNPARKLFSDSSLPSKKIELCELKERAGIPISNTPWSSVCYSNSAKTFLRDQNGEERLYEYYKNSLAANGLDTSLITDKWIQNHYRLIVWKAAAMMNYFENLKVWSVEYILAQLTYRYQILI
jgi:hypothetical protein